MCDQVFHPITKCIHQVKNNTNKSSIDDIIKFCNNRLEAIEESQTWCYEECKSLRNEVKKLKDYETNK